MVNFRKFNRVFLYGIQHKDTQSLGYSCRKASIGSICAARRAGK